MQVRDVMTRAPESVAQTETLSAAAEKMARCNCGVIPVVKNGTVRGIISDRDIVVRAIAQHKNPDTTKVGDCMSDTIASCYEDQSIEAVAKIMEEKQVRRLPVIDKNKRLIGIVSLGDVAIHIKNQKLSGEILEKVSETRARAAA